MSAFRAAATAIGAAVIAAALTAGCAAGKQAQTADEKPSVDGAQGTVGQIQLESVALHAPSGDSYAKGASVPLTVYIVNNGQKADTLTKISSASFPGGYAVTDASAAGIPKVAQVPSPSGSAGSSGQQIGPGSAVGFGLQNLGTSTGISAQSIELKNLTAALYPGESVKITFTFADAGSTTLSAPVQVTSEPYDQTLPAGSASPSE